MPSPKNRHSALVCHCRHDELVLGTGKCRGFSIGQAFVRNVGGDVCGFKLDARLIGKSPDSDSGFRGSSPRHPAKTFLKKFEKVIDNKIE